MPQIKELGCSPQPGRHRSMQWWALETPGGGLQTSVGSYSFLPSGQLTSPIISELKNCCAFHKSTASSKSRAANGQYRNTVLRRNVQPHSVHCTEQNWRALPGAPARLMWYLRLWRAAGDAVCRTGITVMGLKVPTHSSTCFCSFWFLLILPYYGVGKSQCGEKSIKIQFRIIVLCSLAIQGNY